MTQAKKLKSQVRSRAKKTGESYSAARRQVLKKRHAARPARLTQAEPGPAAAPAVSLTRGAVSADKVLERTGKSLEHWFSVLDAFGGKNSGHTAAARHLSDDKGVDGWYAQGITVAYERLHGLRAVNQRVDGTYEVSVSKVVAAVPTIVAAAFNDVRHRALWLREADGRIVRGLEAALGSGKRMEVVKAGAEARLRYAAVGSRVEFNVQAKGPVKSTVVVVNAKLAQAADVDRYRAAWRAALESLREQLAR